MKKIFILIALLSGLISFGQNPAKFKDGAKIEKILTVTDSIKVLGNGFFGELHTITTNKKSYAFGFGNTITDFYSFSSGDTNTSSGYASATFGFNAFATGNFSFAAGDGVTASGLDSHGMASAFAIASGVGSYVGNIGTFARSFGERAVGLFNTDYTPISATSYNAADRLFVIGNGTSSGSRSDAFVMLKNGDATLSGVLTLPDNGLKGATNTIGNIWVGDGTQYNNVLMSGDATIDANGVVTVSDADASALVETAKVNEAGGIVKGQVCYLSGASGGFPQISLASNDDYSKSQVIAIANETKTNGQQISVTLLGIFEDFDTSSFTEGQILYLGVNGGITNVHPGGLDAVVRIGQAVKINPSTGSIIFSPDPLIAIDNVDGFVRTQIVNTSAGTNAIVNTTYVNDASHYLSINMQGSNSSFGSSEASWYNLGYGMSKFINDGNVDHEWYTDVGDTHNNSFTKKMTLSAAGALDVLLGGTFGDKVTISAGGLDVRTDDIIREVNFFASNGENRFKFNTGSTTGPSALSMYDGDGTTIGISFKSAGSSMISGNLGIGTTDPSTKLEVVGDNPGNVGGFPSGGLQIRGPGTTANSNAVITGHNSFNGNTQLWYLGNTSSSNQNLAVINRQNAEMHLHTNDINRFAISASGNFDFKTGIATFGNDVNITGIIDLNAGIGANDVLSDLSKFKIDQGSSRSSTLLIQGTRSVTVGNRNMVINSVMDADETVNVDLKFQTFGGPSIFGGNIDVTGGISYSYVAKTALYTIVSNDYTVDCTSGTFTVTLPTAVGITGKVYVIKNSGGGTITLDGNGSETIDGNLTITATTTRVQSTGANWITI